jgi:hypothetical protein
VTCEAATNFGRCRDGAAGILCHRCACYDRVAGISALGSLLVASNEPHRSDESGKVIPRQPVGCPGRSKRDPPDLQLCGCLIGHG